MFSNGKWCINVNTVGEAIRELSLLDPELPLNQEYEGRGCDIVVMNRSTDMHVAFAEGGFWDDDVDTQDDDELER
jgi:hypothetical protein